MPDAEINRVKTRPTMVEVAHAAGVSVTTVSYVLGGRRGDHAASRISDETRQRVAEAVEAIGYRVNEPARNLRRNRSDRILLLMDRLSSPYEQQLASSIENALGETGRTISIMVCTSLEKLDIALDMVRRRLADGAIVQCRAVVGAQELLESYARDHIPIVAISNVLEPQGFDVVSNDEVPAIDRAIDHLVSTGHRRFGFLGHTADPATPDSRLVLARKRLADHGLALPDDLVYPGARDRLVAFDSTRRLLQLPSPPTALFSASDTGAISAIWAALSLGRRVPDDIAIVGCGNVDEGKVTVPPLSSAGPVDPDFTPIARLLMDRLDDPDLANSRHLKLPWEFIHRQSS